MEGEWSIYAKEEMGAETPLGEKKPKKEPFKGSKKVTVIQNRGRNDVRTFQQRNETLMRHLVWNELVHFMRRR